MTLNFGLVGAGRIGRIHAATLANRLSDARLVAVTDLDRERAAQCARDFHVPRIAENFDEILADKNIDAVAICSSTDTHSPFIIAAAQAGKQIFCEKPVALELPDIDRALDAAERCGVKLMIGFNRRFDPNFHRVHTLIAQGRIGAPNVIHITSRDPAPPPFEYYRRSGGIFLDMTVHDYDMARYLIGSEIRQVYATGGIRGDPQLGAIGDIDTALSVLKFENGVIGTVDNTRATGYGYDQRVQVLGSAGEISVGHETPDETIISDAQGIHTSMPHYFFLERYAEAFVAEMRAFVRAVLADEKPPVTGQDGRIAVVIAMAAKKSLDENRPVQVAEITLTNRPVHE